MVSFVLNTPCVPHTIVTVLFLHHQGQFQKLRGVIKNGQKVIDITPGSVVTVTTVSGVYIAMSLVITAGPWANTLLSHTGLQLTLQEGYSL